MKSVFASNKSGLRARGQGRSTLAAALVLLLACAGCAGRPSASATPATIPATLLILQASAAAADADVYVDGQYLGTIAELGSVDGAPAVDPPKLAPGDHRIEVRKAGRFPAQHTVTVPKRPDAKTHQVIELLEDPA